MFKNIDISKIITLWYNQVIISLIKELLIRKIKYKQYNNSYIKKYNYKEIFTNKIRKIFDEEIYPKNVFHLTYYKLHKDFKNENIKNPTAVKIVTHLLFIYIIYIDSTNRYDVFKEILFKNIWIGFKEKIDEILDILNFKIDIKWLNNIFIKLINNTRNIDDIEQIGLLLKEQVQYIEEKLIFTVTSYEEIIAIFMIIKQKHQDSVSYSNIVKKILIDSVKSYNTPNLGIIQNKLFNFKEDDFVLFDNIIDNIYLQSKYKNNNKYLLGSNWRIEVIVWNKNWYEIKLFSLVLEEKFFKEQIENIIDNFSNTIIEWKDYKVKDKIFIIDSFVINLSKRFIYLLKDTEIWKFLYEDYFLINLYTPTLQTYKIKLEKNTNSNNLFSFYDKITKNSKFIK